MTCLWQFVSWLMSSRHNKVILNHSNFHFRKDFQCTIEFIGFWSQPLSWLAAPNLRWTDAFCCYIYSFCLMWCLLRDEAWKYEQVFTNRGLRKPFPAVTSSLTNCQHKLQVTNLACFCEFSYANLLSYRFSSRHGAHPFMYVTRRSLDCSDKRRPTAATWATSKAKQAKNKTSGIHLPSPICHGGKERRKKGERERRQQTVKWTGERKCEGYVRLWHAD